MNEEARFWFEAWKRAIDMSTPGSSTTKSVPGRCVEGKSGSENKVRASVTHNTLDRDNGGPDTDSGEYPSQQ